MGRELNDPKYTFAVDLGSSQDLIAQQYPAQGQDAALQDRRDEAIVAVVSGEAGGLVNTMLNGLVMTKKANGIGKVMVPSPVLSTPSVVALNWKGDEKWRAPSSRPGPSPGSPHRQQPDLDRQQHGSRSASRSTTCLKVSASVVEA